MATLLRPVALTLTALFAVAGCQQIDGSGVLLTETRPIASFQRVKVSNALPVAIHEGPTDLTITMDDNLLGRIRTRVLDDTLFVGVEDDVNIEPSDGAVIAVASPEIDAVIADAASRVDVRADGDDIVLAADGASHLWARVQAERIVLDTDGASHATLHGATATLELTADGASSVDSDAEATFADVEADGASRVSVLATDRVRVRADGASSVRLSGDPRVRDVRTSGASTVRDD